MRRRVTLAPRTRSKLISNPQSSCFSKQSPVGFFNFRSYLKVTIVNVIHFQPVSINDVCGTALLNPSSVPSQSSATFTAPSLSGQPALTPTQIHSFAPSHHGKRTTSDRKKRVLSVAVCAEKRRDSRWNITAEMRASPCPCYPSIMQIVSFDLNLITWRTIEVTHENFGVPLKRDL